MELKTKYEYMHFVMIKKLPKTNVWSCRNNKSEVELGIVKWYPPWRQYCYIVRAVAVYSSGCLRDIKEFIDTPNAE